jgi:hypothetical protein
VIAGIILQKPTLRSGLLPFVRRFQAEPSAAIPHRSACLQLAGSTDAPSQVPQRSPLSSSVDQRPYFTCPRPLSHPAAGRAAAAPRSATCPDRPTAIPTDPQAPLEPRAECVAGTCATQGLPARCLPRPEIEASPRMTDPFRRHDTPPPRSRDQPLHRLIAARSSRLPADFGLPPYQASLAARA